ncbi:LacI family DNA-binding transcriptional regulator [Tropicimonas sp.]|uniref:LacI family DNA-binding transcriptional regulator n=1 Tax=Tropicimonas sp. TaxID=2067044 RepID=UPI003A8AB183
MVTLKDISQRLGLSVTQVSRALGGHSDVSDTTRARVEEAAQQLGYRPNPAALKLRTGRTGIVGLVVPEHSEQEESNILLEILLGLAVEFWKRGMLVVLNVMPNAGSTAESYTRLFRQGSVDGFVVINPNADPAGLRYLMQEGIPFVSHGRTTPRPDYSYVDLDNRAVGELMATHLTGLGHTDIAFIDGPAGSFSADERLAGLTAALCRHGSEPQPALTCRGIMTEQFGEAATRHLFSNPACPPSALVVGNMVLATGVMRTLGQLGLSVPGDVSVVAHDDVLARYPRRTLTPELSGTRSAFAEAWGHIADLLTMAVDGRDPAALQVLVSPVFVEGRSTAPRG